MIRNIAEKGNCGDCRTRRGHILRAAKTAFHVFIHAKHGASCESGSSATSVTDQAERISEGNSSKKTLQEPHYTGISTAGVGKSRLTTPSRSIPVLLPKDTVRRADYQGGGDEAAVKLGGMIGELRIIKGGD